MANLPVGFINEATVSLREAEQTAIGGSFATEPNYAATSTGIGVNTGSFNPKISDWRRIPRVPFMASMHMGGSGFGSGDRMTYPAQGVLPDGTLVELVFVQAEAETPPLGVLDSELVAINRTGETVPAGAWVFGSISIGDSLDAGIRFTGREYNRVTADGDFRVVN